MISFKPNADLFIIQLGKIRNCAFSLQKMCQTIISLEQFIGTNKIFMRFLTPDLFLFPAEVSWGTLWPGVRKRPHIRGPEPDCGSAGWTGR